jgi:hypothetical protein
MKGVLVRNALAWIILAAGTAACSTGSPLKPQAAAASPDAAPKPFVQNIKAAWKNASLVVPDTAACTPAASATAAGSSPVVSGDFDGDGATDVAAPVKRDDGLHVVAGLRHTYDYKVVDVLDKADTAAERLAVRPRGALYNLPGSDVDYYFGTDTLVIAPCDGSPTAYLWNGQGFDPQPLAK